MDNLCVNGNGYMVYLNNDVAKKIIKGEVLDSFDRTRGGIYKRPAHSSDLPAFDIGWKDGEVVLTSTGQYVFNDDLFDLMKKVKDYLEKVSEMMSVDTYKGHNGNWVVSWKSGALVFKSSNGDDYLGTIKRSGDDTPIVDVENYATDCVFCPDDFVALAKIVKDAETKLPL